jgi:hypothetical protein
MLSEGCKCEFIKNILPTQKIFQKFEIIVIPSNGEVMFYDKTFNILSSGL